MLGNVRWWGDAKCKEIPKRSWEEGKHRTMHCGKYGGGGVESVTKSQSYPQGSQFWIFEIEESLQKHPRNL